MGNLFTPCDAGEVSDGHHTFNELYQHRHMLFIALMHCYPEISWRAPEHADGSVYNEWFIAGMHLPTGDISYHLPAWLWPMLDLSGIETMDKAPEWDGYTPNDVLERLWNWCILVLAIENRRKENDGQHSSNES